MIKELTYVPNIIKPLEISKEARSISNAVCKVVCSGGVASASLVGNNVALTAAHCVWDAKTKEKFANWVAYPGYNYGPYKINGVEIKSGWSKAYYSDLWMKDPNGPTAYDWAILVLEQNLGNNMLYLNVEAESVDSLNNSTVYVLGYPAYGSLDGQRLYKSGGTITKVYTNNIAFSAPSGVGFSGGPVVRANGTVVGVYAGFTNNGAEYTDHGEGSMGVRITSSMKNRIESLK